MALPTDLLTLQSGVVSRMQLLQRGLDATGLRRLIRRRELVVVVPGVYVDHTGALTWVQRAWVGVLALWPAALTHHSAIRAEDGPGRIVDSGVLHVAIDRGRSPAAPPGVRVHHLASLDDMVRWNLAPPRVRIEHALLSVASEARDDITAIATLADAVQARRTTAARLQSALRARARMARRPFLEGVLGDLAHGTCSALEHGYLTLVDRPHGLPAGSRQVLASHGRPAYRDVEYVDEGLVVELDGRLFHDSARARDDDLDRDLEAAIVGRTTVRLGWGQVFGRACTTAARMGELLQRCGWSGAVVPCPRCSAPSTPCADVAS